MKQLIRYILPAFLLLLFTGHSLAQVEYPEDKVKWKYKVEQNGCDATLIAEISIVPNWHIYNANPPEGVFFLPTVFQPDNSKNYKVIGLTLEPKPHFEHDEEADEDLYYHSGKITLKRKIKVLSATDFELKGKFSFQTCDDSHCLPPFEEKFKLKIKGCTDVAAAATEASAPVDSSADVASAGNTPVATDEKEATADAGKPVMKPASDDISKKPLGVIFLLAFGAGFLALIMPCVFPMIPMTVSFFTKQSKTRAQGVRNAFIYGGSIIFIHFLLGAIVVVTRAGHMLNELSTNVYFNIFFFLMLFVFGLSFLGAFEIQLPASWVNKADAKADKGGLIGIFFMALVLSLASFSCTGPILGGLLGSLSVYGGGGPVMVGMTAFGIALALPFMLFAIFPSWMNSMPNSGGWLNVVKVFLGFIEIAFAFKFLSTADTTMQWHLLEREVFLAIWIAVFGTLTLYMFGRIRLPHDSPVDRLSVGRTMIATLSLAFTLYLVPGLWGAPLKLVNAFLPPDFYAESPQGLGGGKTASVPVAGGEHVEGMHEGPQGLLAFNDYDKAVEYAKKVNKPIFVDFTGWGCVNCRKMEQSVWGEPGVIEHLRNDFVIVSLYVDERTELPAKEQKQIKLNGRDFTVTTIGNKWTAKQINEYQTSSQPYYVLQTPDGKDIPVGSADYQHHSDATVFQEWLESGLEKYKK